MTTVAGLDAMPLADAVRALQSCCGSRAWTTAMLARRPFGSAEQLLLAAEAAFDMLADADWLEAFSHHPRLGERRAQTVTTEQSRAWSAMEQARLSESATSEREALAEANAEYEKRFGYIPIVCAMGMSTRDILAVTRNRLSNPPEEELRVAASEQRKITRLRLERLMQQGNEHGAA